MFCTIW